MHDRTRPYNWFAGLLMFGMLMLVIWAVDSIVGIPPNIARIAILSSIVTALAVAM